MVLPSGALTVTYDARNLLEVLPICAGWYHGPVSRIVECVVSCTVQQLRAMCHARSLMRRHGLIMLLHPYESILISIWRRWFLQMTGMRILWR